VLDGQEVDVGEPFIMDGFKIKYPGDPAAPAHLLYNCRCTVIAKVKGVDFDVSDKTQRDDKIGDMSYEEWKGEHKTAPKPPENVPEGKAVEVKVDKPEKGEYKEEKIPEKPKFIPAKTKEEATKYAEKFAEQVNFGKTTLDDMNSINEALMELTDKYPITKLKTIGIQRGKAAMAANYQGLYINSTVIGRDLMPEAERFKDMQEATKKSISSIYEHWQGKKMPSQIKKSVERMEDSLKFKRWSTGQGFESRKEAVKATVAHEYGHIIADQYFGQICGARANANWSKPEVLEMQSKWRGVYEKSKKNGDIYNLTQYGSKNVHEFFAESFAAREMGEQLPDYVESLMKEVLSNGIM
jgi:hypothetical protein